MNTLFQYLDPHSHDEMGVVVESQRLIEYSAELIAIDNLLSFRWCSNAGRNLLPHADGENECCFVLP